MRTAKVALLFVVCLVLCVGSVLAAKDMSTYVKSSRADGIAVVQKATSMVAEAQALLAAGHSNEAVNVLNKVTQMELPATLEANKVIADAYTALGNIYRAESPAKAAINYNLALERMSPQDSAPLQKLIAEVQDGIPTELNPSVTASAPTTLGAGDDTCADAVPVTLPSSEIMNIDPSGDDNWRVITLTENGVIRAETISADIYGDDTRLFLLSGSCASLTQLLYDDDGGAGYLSLITSPCLPAGDYFIVVQGYQDIYTTGDFTLDIQNLGTCVIPAADAYEYDSEMYAAKKIGFRNNGVGQGGQTGRDKKNIQHHSIYPAGDNDYVYFELSRANFVNIETFGDTNPDTFLVLWTSDGSVMAVNDDKAVGDFTSKIAVCLPAGTWYASVWDYYGIAQFEYDWLVDVEHPCLFESEPNGAFGLADSVEPGTTIYGIGSYNQGLGDNDVFTFTLDEAAFVVIETSAYDSYYVDTALELYDGAGNYIIGDEDGGDGYLSRIEIALEPGTYYVNVWSYYGHYWGNGPYGLSITLAAPPAVEVEPNDSCATANAVALGQSFEAQIFPSGDYDYFMLTVPADGFVDVETSGPSGDTVLNIYSADGATWIGCDDDLGDGLFSKWGCCLPAGQYCVESRAYSASSVFSYNITFTDGGACVPNDPLVCPSEGLSCP